MSVEVATKKRGVPRLGAPSVLKQTSALVMRLSDEQRRAFEQRAAREGLSLSAWARMILLREIRNDAR